MDAGVDCSCVRPRVSLEQAPTEAGICSGHRTVNPLSQTDHRPWPLPAGPWIMAQRWCDLLFAHWRVPPRVLRKLVPAELELDLFDGSGWVGVVPFRMEGVRFRGLPPLPGLGAFPELNVRTYVSHSGRPGVWFFSLDAARLLAVEAARAWFHLPYYNARMSCRADGPWGPQAVEYHSERRHREQPSARFDGRYAPTGPVCLSRPGTLEHWLTERYCLYAQHPSGGMLCADVHHAPWPLQPARAEFDAEQVSSAARLELSGEPRLLFARSLDVVVWRPTPVLALEATMQVV